jgi:hypothetical protein
MNLRYAEIESLWPGIEATQRLADQYDIPDISQDAGLKLLQLIIATGLDVVPGRTGADARDRMGNLYEIKSVDLSNRIGATGKPLAAGFTTNHHLTFDTITRYRTRRWVFAMYDRITLKEAYLVEAKDLEPVFQKWESTLRQQHWESGKDGHINNPKIPASLIREVGTVMYLKDVAPAWMEGKSTSSSVTQTVTGA